NRDRAAGSRLAAELGVHCLHFSRALAHRMGVRTVAAANETAPLALRHQRLARLFPGRRVLCLDCLLHAVYGMVGPRPSVRAARVSFARAVLRAVRALQRNPNLETRNPKQIRSTKFEYRNSAL